MSTRRDEFEQVAVETPYDNSDCDLAAENVKEGLDELCQAANNLGRAASPGFSFGRSGKAPNNTWLQCEGVPSNKAGRWCYINDAIITRVYVSSENVDTFDIEVFYHDKTGLGLVSLGAVNIVADYGGRFAVNFSVPTDTEIALRIVNGSAKNIVAGLELTGTDA